MSGMTVEHFQVSLLDINLHIVSVTGGDALKNVAENMNRSINHNLVLSRIGLRYVSLRLF
jgi:hypothetical protein